jgi:hypothetical protein
MLNKRAFNFKYYLLRFNSQNISVLFESRLLWLIDFWMNIEVARSAPCRKNRSERIEVGKEAHWSASIYFLSQRSFLATLPILLGKPQQEDDEKTSERASEHSSSRPLLTYYTSRSTGQHSIGLGLNLILSIYLWLSTSAELCIQPASSTFPWSIMRRQRFNCISIDLQVPISVKTLQCRR